MPNAFYQVEDIVEFSYDAATKTILAAWTNLGPHDYMRPALEAQQNYIRQNDVKVIIIDTAQAKGVAKQEDQNWFQSVIFPELEALGVKAVITVLPVSALSRLAARQWNRTGQLFGIDFIDADTLETARSIAQDYR